MKKSIVLGALVLLGVACDGVLGIESAAPLRDEPCRKWTCSGKTCGFVQQPAGTACNVIGACDDAGECKTAKGESCSGPGDCATGYCVDGVCCESACDEQCKTCNGPGTAGSCEYVDAGAVDNSPPCEAEGAVCDGKGQCSLVNATPCGDGAECLSTYCVDGVCCDSACTGTCMTCTLGASIGKCTLTSLGADDLDTGCFGASLSCDGNGACKQEVGNMCSDDSSCLSGHCVDGVCCGSACTETCRACNLPATLGQCTNISLGLIDSNAAQQCDPGEVCDGFGGCKKNNGQACQSVGQCLSGNCVDGVCCNSQCGGTCNACTSFLKGQGLDGTCGPVVAGYDPENNCSNGACDGSSGCKKELGTLCQVGNECLSGVCADGVCCNTACSSTCMACTAELKGNGATGLCGYITSGRDPRNECFDGSCGGSGTCKNAIGVACSTNTNCLSGICSAGICTGPSCAGWNQPAVHPCNASFVPGGTYKRSNIDPATVSSFRLDKYEVTVARFRKFVDVYPSNKPLAGAGAHPLIPGSGWNPAWDSNLPADQTALKAGLKTSNPPTWTDAAAVTEHYPINNVTWYEAFAFCAWDGGRLPTEAEWNYAAAGGDQQRVWPWSNPPDDSSMYSNYASYGCTGDSDSNSCTLYDIGEFWKWGGAGRWGQISLVGSMNEWTLDLFQAEYPSPCTDCAQLTVGSERVLRGGDWNKPSNPGTYARWPYDPKGRSRNFGFRCARNP